MEINKIIKIKQLSVEFSKQMEKQSLDYIQKSDPGQIYPDDVSQQPKFQNKTWKGKFLFVVIIILFLLLFGIGGFFLYQRYNFNQQHRPNGIIPTPVFIPSSSTPVPTLTSVINPSVLPSPRVSTNIQAIDVTSMIKEVELSGNIINLTNDNYEQMSPKIYQNTIVWLDLSENSIPECQTGNIAHKPCISEIYMYDRVIVNI